MLLARSLASKSVMITMNPFKHRQNKQNTWELDFFLFWKSWPGYLGMNPAASYASVLGSGCSGGDRRPSRVGAHERFIGLTGSLGQGCSGVYEWVWVLVGGTGTRGSEGYFLQEQLTQEFYSFKSTFIDIILIKPHTK